MMQWSQKAMESKKFDVALDFLDQVVTLSPDYAEGWNRRATVHFMMQNYAKSMADIDHTLQLEPRHFGALSGMAQIMKNTDRKELALEGLAARARHLSDDAQRPERGGDAVRRARRRRHLIGVAPGLPRMRAGLAAFSAVSSRTHEPRLRRRLPSCLRCFCVLAGVTRVGAWLIERRNPPVGSLRRDRRRAPAPRPCPGAGKRRTAADRLHPWRQRQSERPDGAAEAAARRPRRDAVLRPARAMAGRSAARGNDDAGRPGQRRSPR